MASKEPTTRPPITPSPTEDGLLLSLRRDMDRLFDRFAREYSPLPVARERLSAIVPAVDVKESDKEITVSAELPGMDEKDVDVSVSRGVLTIRGEKKEEKEEKDRNYYRMERSFGSFHRTLALPEGLEIDRAEADFKKGVLTVRIPRSKEAQAAIKKIPIKS